MSLSAAWDDAVKLRMRWMMVVLSVTALLGVSMRLLWPERSVAAGGRVSANASAKTGDQVCAGCHREIYDRYERTLMAQASGAAMDGLLQGSFKHAPSGVEYKVFARDGQGWMSYYRDRDPSLSGERSLRYFVGSGHRGRTYLYEESGLWFEVPINYYGKKQVWDMAPHFEGARSMPDGLPVDSNCLHCHATEVQPSLPTARNRYITVPFRLGGVGCVACHGDASEHIAKEGHGPIVNPAKLTAQRRDSICLQCHLEGDEAIYFAGKSLQGFRAGDDLSKSVAYFVKASAQGGGGRAASQWEALLRSRCKIASGDKLTCTTCHDPHGAPSEEERVGYFRGKCLSCHAGMAVQHHQEQQDCAVCHMPTRKTTDISHEQTTDHDIGRTVALPLNLSSLGASSNDLVPVGQVAPGDREYGLAYAQVAQGGDRDAAGKAAKLLQKAEAAGADDAELHAELGLVKQMAGDVSGARKEYQQALVKDAHNATALGNLAVLEGSSGNAAEAMRLLRQVVEDDPSQITAGLNLAFIECSTGQKDEAKKVLEGLQRFSPDNPMSREFLVRGVYRGQRCALSAGVSHP